MGQRGFAGNPRRSTIMPDTYLLSRLRDCSGLICDGFYYDEPRLSWASRVARIIEGETTTRFFKGTKLASASLICTALLLHIYT